jgi:hypothetical protein
MIMHRLALLCLLASAFLFYACAEPNTDAPAGGLHPLDGSYLDPGEHGPDAKADLTFCQGCHGEAGGPGDNPRFNGGSVGVSCEDAACHDTNLAHPQDWAGVNSTFHYSAGKVQQACTLCHGVDLDGVGGVGPSCLDCHDSPTTFTLDCTYCHGYPPDGSPDMATATGVDHSEVATTVISFIHGECTLCHGMSESAAGGDFEPETNYTLFSKSTDTLGDHWDGNIQMNADAGYNDSTFGCGTTVCHGNDDTQDPMPNSSGLPVILKNFGL